VFYEGEEFHRRRIGNHADWNILRASHDLKDYPEIYEQLHEFPAIFQRLLKGTTKDTDDLIILKDTNGKYGSCGGYIRMLPFVEGNCKEFNLPENPKAPKYGFEFHKTTKIVDLKSYIASLSEPTDASSATLQQDEPPPDASLAGIQPDELPVEAPHTTGTSTREPSGIKQRLSKKLPSFRTEK
jgi:hypothetical protein